MFELDPLTDPRWAEFADRHTRSGVFHTVEWIKALHQTFGYTARVFTRTAPKHELRDGVPFCYIHSRLTGNRLVSLPFSDHCEPLGSEPDIAALLEEISFAASHLDVSYVEIRPTELLHFPNFSSSESLLLHRLDLSPPLQSLFHSLQKSSIQRSIRRAERLGLTLKEGRSEWHLRTFYKLFVQTRRRLQAPPHPIEWFRNLLACMGDKISIRVALENDYPLASIITLQHKRIATYKYGCSDASRHNRGAMPFLLWKAIEEAKHNGAAEFDFGRTETDNTGLTTFKNRWGATPSNLTYYRTSGRRQNNWRASSGGKILRSCLSRLPDAVFVRLGRVLYRHIG